MVRVLFLTSLIFLIGCTTGPEKIKTETIEIKVPILYCPAPPKIQRPILAIEMIGPNTSDGEIAKRYKASIIQLQDYAKRLEESLNQYDKTSQSYEQLKTELLITEQKQKLLENKTQ